MATDLETWKVIATAFITWSLMLVGFMLWLNKQFTDTRHSLRGSMDMRFKMLDDKIEELNKEISERIHKIELRNAAIDGAKKTQRP